MSGISGARSSYIPEFNKKIDKQETTNLINKIKTEDASGEVKLTKEDFKTLAKQFKGGKEELGKLLEGISPKGEIDKLKAFTFSRDGQTTNITLSGLKKEQFVAKLDTLLNKVTDKKEDMSSTILGVKNKLATFTGKAGEFTERSTVVKLSAQVSGAVGSPIAKDSAWETPLGLANTDGLAAELGIEGSVGVKATAKTVDGGKVQLSYEFQALAEGKAKASMFKVAQHEGNFEGSLGIGKKKTVTYTFANKDEAVKFIEKKGKDFKIGSPDAPNTYSMEKTGFETVTSKSTLTTKSASVKRSTEPSKGWYSSIKNAAGNLFGFRSVQVSTFKKEKVGDESTKTFSLDTKSKFLSFEKKTTSTNLSITKNKDQTTGHETFSGNFSMDINIEKIKNNKDRDALIEKLVGRFDQVATKFDENSYGSKVTLNKGEIRAYITHSVDNLIKAEGLFKDDGTGKLQSTKSGQKVGEKSVDQFKFEASGNIGIGASAEIKATKSKMVRINLPLEMSGNELKPKDDSARIQLSEFNMVGLTVGAELEIGSESVVGAKAAAKIGFEKGSTTARDVMSATKTAITDNTSINLSSLTVKKNEAYSKNTDANIKKVEAITAFDSYKKLTGEVKQLETKLKGLEDKLAKVNSYTGSEFLRPKMSDVEKNSILQIRATIVNKKSEALGKITLAESKINEAKTLIAPAKTLSLDAVRGIETLHGKATQNRELKTALMEAKSKNATIEKNNSEIEKLSNEISPLSII